MEVSDKNKNATTYKRIETHCAVCSYVVASSLLSYDDNTKPNLPVNSAKYFLQTKIL